MSATWVQSKLRRTLTDRAGAYEARLGVATEREREYMATALVGICSATQWQQAARSLHQKAHPSDLQDARAPGLLAGPRFCPPLRGRLRLAEGRPRAHALSGTGGTGRDLRAGRSARARRLPCPALGRQWLAGPGARPRLVEALTPGVRCYRS
jgi:hypothetical protein